MTTSWAECEDMQFYVALGPSVVTGNLPVGGRRAYSMPLMRRPHARLAAGLALVTVTLAAVLQAADPPTRRFYPDDPIWTDPDRAVDAGELPEIPEGDLFDFVRNTFLQGGTG